MTTEQKIEIIKGLVLIITDCQKEVQNLGEIINRECELFAAYDRMESDYVAAVSSVVGDENGWLCWYVFDNDCGRKGLEAGNKGELTVIDTVAKLVKLIETTEKPISYIGKSY